MKRAARGKAASVAIFFRVVGDDSDTSHALGEKLRRDVGRRDLAFEALAFNRLPAGHSDCAVQEYLVGDVDARRDAGADCEQTGMEIGAVAQILKNMRRVDKGC